MSILLGETLCLTGFEKASRLLSLQQYCYTEVDNKCNALI